MLMIALPTVFTVYYAYVNRVFLLTARGYQWDYFVWCQLALIYYSSCPPTKFNVPSGHCRLPEGLKDEPLLLLTADGLASHNVQSAFSTLLQEAATNLHHALSRTLHSVQPYALNQTLAAFESIEALNRTVLALEGSHNLKSLNHDAAKHFRHALKQTLADVSHLHSSVKLKHHRLFMGKQGVVYVCDASYAAREWLGPNFVDCVTYCRRRQHELMSLGATEVACFLLNPGARWDVLATATEILSPIYYNFTDAEMVELLGQAAGIFVEGGETFYVLASFRRLLDLGDNSSPVSFGDLVAARVHARTLAYVGVSAGSIIAGETASIAQIWPYGDAELMGGNFTGLQLVRDCVFLPHFTPSQEPFLRSYEAGLSYACPLCRAIAIPQCQPLVSGLKWLETTRQMDYVCPS